MSEALPDRILDHFEGPYHCGPHPSPTHSCAKFNVACGDCIGIALDLTGGSVRSAWHTAEGCMVSRAAASILTEWAEGRTVQDLRGLASEDMLRLFGFPELTPGRWKCVLLAWEAMRGALE